MVSRAVKVTDYDTGDALLEAVGIPLGASVSSASKILWKEHAEDLGLACISQIRLLVDHRELGLKEKLAASVTELWLKRIPANKDRHRLMRLQKKLRGRADYAIDEDDDDEEGDVDMQEEAEVEKEMVLLEETAFFVAEKKAGEDAELRRSRLLDLLEMYVLEYVPVPRSGKQDRRAEALSKLSEIVKTSDTVETCYHELRKLMGQSGDNEHW